MAKNSVHEQKSARMGRGGWLAATVLVALLIGAIWVAAYGWNLADGVDIDTPGKVALVLGVVVSMLVGGGLMGLLFWSNRRGYDR